MTILVTGGAGYIGSHTCVELLNAGNDVVVIDDFSNSSPEALARVEQLTGKKITFYQGSIADAALLKHIFDAHSIRAVLNFAGFKAVGESTRQPVRYYQNNVAGTLTLIEAMLAAKVHTFVFSSTATVYGDPERVPVTEESAVGATTNPYATSKFIVEQMLRDIVKAHPEFSAIVLRYFNPVGAHESGLIGEDPNGIPNNLLPFISQVAVGKLPELAVFGNDYNTPDGTGVRDYIHVVDLAVGHLKALETHCNEAGFHVYNLGTGVGYSVLDMIKAFERVNGLTIPYKVVARRPGDVDSYYSLPTKAQQKLGWQATRDLDAMMRDTWNWQKNNPNGFEK